MKKVLLFPYHPDVETLLEYEDDLDGFKIAGLISYVDDEAVTRRINDTLGLKDAGYNELLQSCDAVLLLDNYRNYKPDKYYQVIEDALTLGKGIYITPLAQTQLDLAGYEGRYSLLRAQPQLSEETLRNIREKANAGMNEINAPIIAVMGQGKNCNKFEVQLLLKQLLEEDRAVFITSNALGAMFGCYTTPSFLYSSLPFDEKIEQFNRFVYEIEQSEAPEIIVIGVPEGVAPFAHGDELNRFGEFPLIISNACLIDMTILCTYFMRRPLPDAFSSLNNYFRARFNAPVDAVAISKVMYELIRKTDDIVEYNFLDRDYLEKYYPDLNAVHFPVLNLFDKGDTKCVLSSVLHRLQENADKI